MSHILTVHSTYKLLKICLLQVEDGSSLFDDNDDGLLVDAATLDSNIENNDEDGDDISGAIPGIDADFDDVDDNASDGHIVENSKPGIVEDIAGLMLLLQML